jgi:serine/threonine-protein kinase
MDAARWHRMREIVEHVSALPVIARDDALAKACGGDAGLLDDLRSLLGSNPPGESLFDGIVTDALSALGRVTPADRRVGPYRIVREIGQGGMGAVYLAERADGGFEQQVALKLVKPGLATDQFLRRFRDERQILARLQHPNIARLLDGGVDEQGRPYFALEYVAGEPIDRYCDAHALGVEERLTLFQDACRAVMYAHANLVVHRDLKPAHILVTADRQVRLLDFGIAKVLDEDPAEAAGLTQAGIRALTPEYASPEQVGGRAVGTATDVYSLGVILYELLTGVRPYDFDTRTPAEIERIVCALEPGKPSTRVSDLRRSTSSDTKVRRGPPVEAARLRRRLRGDLDVICLAALQKEPARRYPSVEALSEDIRRSLAGLPVVARPDSLRYRAGKFVARHRVGAGIAALVAVGFAATVGYYTAHLAGERDRTALEAAKAEQVATFLRGLFEVSDPSESRGRSVTARELLDEGAARIERELAGQPGVRASLMRVIGDVYQRLGLAASARPLLERALAELRGLHGDTHDEVADAEMALAFTLQNLGDVTGAEPLFRQALATRRLLYGDPHEKVSESLAGLSFLLETRGETAGAEVAAREALAMVTALFDSSDPRVAKATADLAGLLRRQDRMDEAEPLLRQALAAQRQHYGDVHLTVASTIRNLASLLRDRGELDEAETLYREALTTRRAILGDVHPDVAIAINSHAILLDRKGDHAAAAEAYREFLDIAEQVHQGRPHPDLAAGYSNLAASLRSLGRDEEAVAGYERSIDMVDQVLAPEHPNRAFPRIGLAITHMDQGRFAQAEPLIREVLAIRRAGLPAGHRLIADTLVELGVCLTGLARYADAERSLIEARRSYLASGSEGQERAARAERRLEALYKAWGKAAPARQP